MLLEIMANRQRQVTHNKTSYPVELLEKSPYFDRQPVSLSQQITDPDKHGIIAEFKRRSPSKGFINKGADILEVTTGYVNMGASALSVLTEEVYFSGGDRDLILARTANECPILRKDFMVEEYQVIESRSLGADAVLLIAACLDSDTLRRLYRLARSLGMEVLFEVHEAVELDKIPGDDLIIGVNNRNLKTMKVDIQTSIDLAKLLPDSFVKVSESGLNTAHELRLLRAAGYDGFLIGEQFMKYANPALALKEFIEQL